ncbi:uncharacterized protein METZ01_LOCUS411494, partial [marine metagenome]
MRLDTHFWARRVWVDFRKVSCYVLKLLLEIPTEFPADCPRGRVVADRPSSCRGWPLQLGAPLGVWVSSGASGASWLCRISGVVGGEAEEA